MLTKTSKRVTMHTNKNRECIQMAKHMKKRASVHISKTHERSRKCTQKVKKKTRQRCTLKTENMYKTENTTQNKTKMNSRPRITRKHNTGQAAKKCRRFTKVLFLSTIRLCLTWLIMYMLCFLCVFTKTMKLIIIMIILILTIIILRRFNEA